MKYLLTSLLLLIMNSCTDNNLSNIKSWGYQLQNYQGDFDYKRISKSSDRLWVIDYASDELPLTQKTISSLKKNNNILISYLSIGEAESYRPYFPKLPKDLLVEVNKDWEGNYRVKYWDTRWHDVMIEYLDKILAAGFDGVYLDIVDAFDYYEEGEEKKKKAEDMFEFVKKLQAHAKSINPDFLFIQQNGLSIISHIENNEGWFDLIDAVGIESMFFSGDQKMNNPFKLDDSIIKYLRSYQKEDVPVFSVEYINDKKLASKYKSLAKDYSVIPLAATKNLDGPMLFSSELE